MRRSCCSSLLLLVLALCSLLHAAPSVGFYYGTEPTAEMIERYDWMVVDADQIDPIWVKRYPRKLFAYVSVGEIEPWRHEGAQIPKAWSLRAKSSWGGTVANLSDPSYRAWLLKGMRRLYRQGYRNFFLDTLDAPIGAAATPRSKAAMRTALAETIDAIRDAFPHAKLIANRGVEVMPTLCKKVDGFAIESLYRGIDTRTMRYRAVSPQDRLWIQGQLERAKTCGLLPIVIDYVDPSDSALREKTARKIASDGYIPFVTDLHLSHDGRGADRPVRRRILLLYDGTTLKDHDRVYSNVHLMASMPLEYLGYIPVLHDLREGLPYAGTDRYAGVIVWPSSYAKHQRRFFDWIKKWIERKQKFLFINGFGFEMTPDRAAALGIGYKKSTIRTGGPARILHHASCVGYELPPFARQLSWLPKAPSKDTLIEASNDAGERFDPAAIMPWGGYAIAGSAERDLGSEPHWLIDPFVLFARALRLGGFPVPDPTTENGRRISFVHIDGDGFIEKARFAPNTYASEVLLRSILTRYRIPHSISIIEGEIGPKGLYPDLSPKMEAIARTIFALPYVEPASHTYSHPFKWRKLEQTSSRPKKAEGAYHLPIPGYRFDLSREIEGSVSYIEHRLLAKGRKCRLLFWSGDCLPRADALRMCERDRLLAINGGDTTVTDAHPWLGRIAPFGLQRGAFWQIYVGEQNENIYTNDWLGPYWGYRRVIETFRRTESPRRLKPIDIYYHFYSASKSASLDALQRVYRWVMRQKSIPLYTSEYIDIAHDFYRTAILYEAGGFRVRNAGALRTLRIDKKMGYPDLRRSRGVVGYRDTKQGRYLHLDGSGDVWLKLRPTPPTDTPYLIASNARIAYAKRSQKELHVRLSAHVPLRARFYLPRGCRVSILGRGLQRRMHGRHLQLFGRRAKTAEVHIVCR